LPSEVFTPFDVAEIYRLRWEVELFFRDLKGAVRLDEVTRLKNPASLRMALLASLVAATLGQELTYRGAQRRAAPVVPRVQPPATMRRPPRSRTPLPSKRAFPPARSPPGTTTGSRTNRLRPRLRRRSRRPPACEVPLVDRVNPITSAPDDTPRAMAPAARSVEREIPETPARSQPPRRTLLAVTLQLERSIEDVVAMVHEGPRSLAGQLAANRAGVAIVRGARDRSREQQQPTVVDQQRRTEPLREARPATRQGKSLPKIWTA
jgi:hypothetical protein